MNKKITITPIGEIYELSYIYENYDGAYCSNEFVLNLENTTLDEVIERELSCFTVVSAFLYKKDVFEDEEKNKYFSESKLVKEIQT